MFSRRSCQRFWRTPQTIEALHQLPHQSAHIVVHCLKAPLKLKPSMFALKKAVSASAVNTVDPSLFRTLANESSIRTDAVNVVLTKTSSVFTSSSKPRTTYRAFDVTSPSRSSTHLPLITLWSCSYTSAHSLVLQTLEFRSFGCSFGLTSSGAASCLPSSRPCQLSTWRRSSVSTALIFMSASGPSRHFFAASAAEAHIPTVASHFPCCTMFDTRFST